MKYCEDSTVEKLGREYVCKTRGHVELHACAIRGVRDRYEMRERDAVREDAMPYARVRCRKQRHVAERENTPMSDNLLKRRMHCTQTLYILQII